MVFKVLIPEDISDVGKDYLKERNYQIVMGSGNTEEAILKDVVDCDAILARTARFSRKVLEAGKRLKVISRYGAGTDNIDVDSATKLGIWVTNAPVANTNSVAEHAIALLLACAANLVHLDHLARSGDWGARNRIKCTEVVGKVLGIIGLGRIGRNVAKKADGLGMKIIGYDTCVSKEVLDSKLEIVANPEEVFQKADFISLHIPVMPETRGSINASLFRRMKKGAYLINCARGEVVNENDLYMALRQGWFRGAGLDVLAVEPPQKHHPLLTLDNVIISPHNAALTDSAMDRMGIHAAMGIDEVLSGNKPTWPVNHLEYKRR